ncbi:hypothetical protein E5F05_00465 (plasmid) [Deinococcus metallilatus]|uniref:1,2-phenylacetyl-CoA epoxidase catalytic subunit n=1 Tax=Deinococcus metallilatus TaxID=1211322 RepID=A0AAJ5FC32_9DEIO|nr:Phenylacetic acid catabolic protein [Deinococcus metallilatus]MBB5293371.1 1,2-phenylacetyl-CoA epoxidase catalytic subunit [Deinococcus metallilatus]QBY06473.1 hypothetical protein E5F05_00465 [Deinococcus metallilatus]RXJ17816.1 hypothetical protein ERJ73_00075 [Deinococcus metallilatus]TLK32088.1 hypothetical protein FCS05_01095 [Deinococcus metallilatus]
MTQTETKAAKYATLNDLPQDLRAELFAFLLALTDTKQRLGFQISHWVTGTPALEGAVGAAALAQDELGHARSLYALLRTFPEAPESLNEENDLRSTRVRVHPDALDNRWDTWLKLVAMSVTLDAALQEVFRAARDFSFAPLASLAVKINQEEKFHRVFGDTWLARLAALDDTTREHLQKELNWAYPIAEAWLGNEVESNLVREGILGESLSDIRPRWRRELEDKVQQSGLTVPAERTDWSHWDAERREVLIPV